MSTAYVVANGNITNRPNQQNANSAGSGSILLANAPGDRDKTDGRVISSFDSSYDSYEQYNYENYNPQAPPTYDDGQSNTTKNYEIEYDPDDVDLSYDEAYIRAPVPNSPGESADSDSATATEAAEPEVETTTTPEPIQNQNTTTITAN